MYWVSSTWQPGWVIKGKCCQLSMPVKIKFQCDENKHSIVVMNGKTFTRWQHHLSETILMLKLLHQYYVVQPHTTANYTHNDLKKKKRAILLSIHAFYILLEVTGVEGEEKQQSFDLNSHWTRNTSFRWLTKTFKTADLIDGLQHLGVRPVWAGL